MSKKKQNIEVEIRVANGNSSKEEQLYHYNLTDKFERGDVGII